MGYYLDTIENLTFGGLAVSYEQVSPSRSRVKCVAFEGVRIGRRFYRCYVPNVGLNSQPLSVD
jgi:hypothetical protein